MQYSRQTSLNQSWIPVSHWSGHFKWRQNHQNCQNTEVHILIKIPKDSGTPTLLTLLTMPVARFTSCKYCLLFCQNLDESKGEVWNSFFYCSKTEPPRFSGNQQSCCQPVGKPFYTLPLKLTLPGCIHFLSSKFQCMLCNQSLPDLASKTEFRQEEGRWMFVAWQQTAWFTRKPRRNLIAVTNLIWKTINNLLYMSAQPYPSSPTNGHALTFLFGAIIFQQVDKGRAMHRSSIRGDSSEAAANVRCLSDNLGPRRLLAKRL